MIGLSVSSLPIMEKGEQFLKVIEIFALLCSHYKMSLERKYPLLKFYIYAIIVATMYVEALVQYDGNGEMSEIGGQIEFTRL
jgi:hypothetical protein